MLLVMVLNATTSSTGPEKPEWSWWTNGKLKERSLMPTGTILQGILSFLKNTFSPKSNALIMILELKRLFQGSMSLEDFHTKALRLVKEGEYPEGTHGTGY